MKNQNTDIHLLVDKTDYHSFLLRIWKTKAQNGSHWHLSLENPITHELVGFQNLHAFNNYLTQLFEKTQVLSDNTNKGDTK
jgi:hypothetical protein